MSVASLPIKAMLQLQLRHVSVSFPAARSADSCHKPQVNIARKSAAGLCKTRAQTKRTKCKKSGLGRRWFQNSDVLVTALAGTALPQAEASRLHDGCGSWNVSTRDIRI